MGADVAHYRSELSRIIAGRRWLVATDVLVGAVRHANELLALGACDVFALGGTRGTGDIDVSYAAVALGVAGAADMMEGIRAGEAALEALPPEVQARIDAFDPEHEARVLGTLFASDRPVAGRLKWGARPDRWAALEDKMRVDALWDRAGVTRAPSAVVTVADAPAAHARLDAGRGTVWVADNRTGWHGGAQYLRWVRNAASMPEATRVLGAVADRVRVMPFLEGIPCSIHGAVFPGGETIAFRPCELMVLRRPGSGELAYAAASTYWLPRESDAEVMREVARRVGAYLRDAHGYRGTFTVDGVMTREGFLPTELNPRYGAALGQLAAGEPELPLYVLHLALTAGEELEYRPGELERLVVEASLAQPAGRAHRLVPGPLPAREGGLVFEGTTPRFAGEGEEPALTVRVGPAASGSIIMLFSRPGALPLGPPLAPRIAAAFAFLDREWSLGVGRLEAAPDVRG
ncbi:MAG: hypothetical protein AAF447_02015 [Myxococcota bacterium]